MKSRLVLLRHGKSVYNDKNLFTGWTDVDLSQRGIKEAKEAGEILKKNAILPDIAFTSWLKRAIHTQQIVLKQINWEHIDSIKSWKLNERHYGAWQQKNKDEIKKEVGEEFFVSVRRGYETRPPLLDKEDKRSPYFDLKYKNLSIKLPLGESLLDTQKRAVNYFFESIAPFLAKGKTVLLTAHGNSLRALCMWIENIKKEDIVNLEIPTAKPILYEFDESLHLLKKEFLQ